MEIQIPLHINWRNPSVGMYPALSDSSGERLCELLILEAHPWAYPNPDEATLCLLFAPPPPRLLGLCVQRHRMGHGLGIPC